MFFSYVMLLSLTATSVSVACLSGTQGLTRLEGVSKEVHVEMTQLAFTLLQERYYSNRRQVTCRSFPTSYSFPAENMLGRLLPPQRLGEMCIRPLVLRCGLVSCLYLFRIPIFILLSLVWMR